jgi:hypothetical protein
MKQTPDWNRSALLGMHAFEPLHPVIARMEKADFPTLADWSQMLAAQDPAICVHNGKPLRFVPQEYGQLPFERQYEPRCYLHGEVPTREDNWHDLLNALVWFAFPRSKAAINLRHYLALTSETDLNSQRGAVRDMNTLLDESGVIVPCANEELAGLLRDFRWKELFWQRRAEVMRDMGFYLFGHGLYEKALKPYIGMTGQGLLLPVEPAFFDLPPQQRLASLDERVAGYLLQPGHCRSTRELTPVPLLGIPGWTSANEDASFYDDVSYFRSARQSRAQRTPLSTAPSSVAG